MNLLEVVNAYNSTIIKQYHKAPLYMGDIKQFITDSRPVSYSGNLCKLEIRDNLIMPIPEYVRFRATNKLYILCGMKATYKEFKVQPPDMMEGTLICVTSIFNTEVKEIQETLVSNLTRHQELLIDFISKNGAYYGYVSQFNIKKYRKPFKVLK